MKVAFTVGGKDLNAVVEPRFGRCSSFLVMDTERGLYEIHGNEGQSASSGAGITAAQCLVNMGVEAVVTGNVGPNALGILSAAGIPVYRGAGIPVSEALEQFKQGILEEISQAVPKHYGLNMGGK